MKATTAKAGAIQTSGSARPRRSRRLRRRGPIALATTAPGALTRAPPAAVLLTELLRPRGDADGLRSRAEPARVRTGAPLRHRHHADLRHADLGDELLHVRAGGDGHSRLAVRPFLLALVELHGVDVLVPAVVVAHLLEPRPPRRLRGIGELLLPGHRRQHVTD